MKTIVPISSDKVSETLNLGFIIWAKNYPKNYLAQYPVAAQKIYQESLCSHGKLVAIVDDILPQLVFQRTEEEQGYINMAYTETLPKLGFDSTVLLSSLGIDKNIMERCIHYGKQFTTSQFLNLLPSKKMEMQTELQISEIIEFLWQLYVVEVSMKEFNLNGFLSGIRSEFFYYAVRQCFNSLRIYFVDST